MLKNEIRKENITKCRSTLIMKGHYLISKFKDVYTKLLLNIKRFSAV